jgi:hypothetical protein
MHNRQMEAASGTPPLIDRSYAKGAAALGPISGLTKRANGGKHSAVFAVLLQSSSLLYSEPSNSVTVLSRYYTRRNTGEREQRMSEIVCVADMYTGNSY